MTTRVLDVQQLSVNYMTKRNIVEAVKNVNFSVNTGEILGIVGESGCGKTTVAMSILRLIQPPGKVVSGKIFLQNQNILDLDYHNLLKIRWKLLSLIPQGAMNSLNPVVKVKEQISEVIKTHTQFNKISDDVIVDLLDKVNLKKSCLNMYPHELSGGMKQRICIAKAVALNPRLIIADEPTSALDVVVQRVIAQTLKKIQKETGVSMVIIGHDMGLMAQIVDRVMVMKSGKIVEISNVDELFKNPKDKYTKILIDSVPSIQNTRNVASHRFKINNKSNDKNVHTDPKAIPILELKNIFKTFSLPHGLFTKDRSFCAVNNFNLRFEEKSPRIITLAGESGSGKTTVANIALGNLLPSSGNVYFSGQNILTLNNDQKVNFRRNVQAVFQDPYAVYNPFYRVKHVFDLVIKNFKLQSNKLDAHQMIEDALNVVGLKGEDVLSKYPHQLSGGQRQRMMLARAFLLKPSVIVADEPVSMVDASLRAMIIDLMLKLKEDYQISFLYITHDLSTAYQIGDDIIIMLQGKIVEKGPTKKVIDNPQHAYVKLLVDSIPRPDPSDRWNEDIDNDQSTYVDLIE